MIACLVLCFLVRLLTGYNKHCLIDFGQDQQASAWKPDRGRRRRADDKRSEGQREKLSQRKPPLRKAPRSGKWGGRERKGLELGNQTGTKCLRDRQEPGSARAEKDEDRTREQRSVCGI